MKKKKQQRGLSQSVRQKQRMTMRYAIVASAFFIVASTGFIYFNLSNHEKTVAADTQYANTINYRSTNPEISERYLRTTESINKDGRPVNTSGDVNGKISMPSRAQDVVTREINISTINNQ